MPLAFDAAATARLAQPVRGAHWLVELDFAGGTIRLTSAAEPIQAGGYTYTALGMLLEVSNVVESATSTNERLTFGLAVTSSAQFAAAMGDPATYRGRAARLMLQVIDDTFRPVGAPKERWAGYMDKINIDRKPAAKGGGASSGRIQLVCSRAGMARVRSAQGLRLTHAQQQTRYPGDTGLRYVTTLVQQPTRWLSKKFQEI